LVKQNSENNSVAGTSVTYKTAVYLLYHLAQNPDKQVSFTGILIITERLNLLTLYEYSKFMIQEILHKEIQSIVGRGVDGPSYMRLTSSYLAAALKESQRLLPAKGPHCSH
jgi:hypothetical protein